MDLHLYNTLTRRKERFQPLDPKNVRMYVCGPTVYQRIHIGNARPLIVFDVLFRLLQHLSKINGWDKVTYVRNITDIDDKIIDQARKDDRDFRDLTKETIEQFHEDCGALGLLPPTHEPRASEFVPEMVLLIEKLIARSHAYVAEGHILFSVPSMLGYGRLSGRNRDEQVAGARVEVAPYKRDPADFVLWKPSTEAQPGWDSPWGRGRPGWHIECSAMSERLLGVPFDIHGGGLDLIFPHHENEIAQSCCAHNLDEMARYWVHNGFVDMRGEKMSKSKGNVVRLDEALAVAPGEAIRFLLLQNRYSQPSDFNDDALQEAKRRLGHLYNSLHLLGLEDPGHVFSGQPLPEVVDALCDDLNTALAISVIRHNVVELNKMEDGYARRFLAHQIQESGWLLGILQGDPEAYRRRPTVVVGSGETAGLPISAGELASKIALRNHRRAARRFAEADAIRDNLRALGIVLEDRPDGSTDWRRA